MKILAIIPAFNEAANIENVIDDLTRQDLELDLLVVNDGSEDATGVVAEKSGKSSVVNLPCNLGIGGGVQTGFKFADIHEYDIAFQFDGDGQHKASEVPKILDPIIHDQADVVIGSRFLKSNSGYQSTFLRRIGIKIFESVNSVLIKQTITDNTSGLRAYNRKAIEFLARHYPLDYPEPETVILLGRNGFRMIEVPVTMQERIGGKSSISGLDSFYYMIKVLLAIFINCLRPKIIKD